MRKSNDENVFVDIPSVLQEKLPVVECYKNQDPSEVTPMKMPINPAHIKIPSGILGMDKVSKQMPIENLYCILNLLYHFFIEHQLASTVNKRKLKELFEEEKNKKNNTKEKPLLKKKSN